jgi:DAK2 domain fusion protein YloV
MVLYRDGLRAHQEAINRLNVYPVPDGDTGTNMMLTLDAVVIEVEALQGSSFAMADVCKAIAHGSLMGARGNSGVILSQLLRGATDRLAGCGEAGPAEVAEALELASTLARQAVVRPVEGTILTVASAAAQGAQECAHGGAALVEVLDAARRRAADALASTPDLLPVLAEAGVVDAGGSGYLLMLDALVAVVDERPMPQPPEVVDARPPVPLGHAGGAGGVGELRYEVMYLLEAPDHTIPAFKDVWAGIGDSIVVVGGDSVWNCHIHTDDVGAAIEAALDAGRPRSIRVTDLLEQVVEERWVREGASSTLGPQGAPEDRPAARTGVVAVVSGKGIGRIFRSLGVTEEVAGGQSMNPSTAQILDAVEHTGSAQVVVLPNNPNIRAVAERVDELSSRSVGVVPTGSVVEGFAALLAYDPDADLEENVSAMTMSARRVVPAEVTRAVRDARTPAGSVRQGDWIGISRGTVMVRGDGRAAVGIALLERLLEPNHELVTIIEGVDATAGDTRHISEWLGEEHPGVATEVHHGGQSLYPYLFGIE